MAKKENYHTIRYGNKDGEIKFGHIHEDNVLSSFMVRSGYDSEHYMQFDSDSKRKGWTTNVCPGTFTVQAGRDTKKNQFAVVVEALNGDLWLNAPRGRIRINAENIDIIATGGDNKNGVVNIHGNEAVNITGNNVKIKSSTASRFFSSGSTKIISQNYLDIYSGFIDCADGATVNVRSLLKSENEDENQ
jgi:hypothetical protein